jgi:hypothetical protein
VDSRVTRLGDFSPTYWATVYFGQIFLKIAKVSKSLVYFFHNQIFILIETKNGLGYLLGDYLQTHLVTLVDRQEQGCQISLGA